MKRVSYQLGSVRLACPLEVGVREFVADAKLGPSMGELTE
jgi:hypothetical protein